MRDRTQHHQKHHQKHHQHHRTQANLISIAVLFIFYLLTPIKTYADQPTTTPTSLEIQRATVGIKGKVLANSDYDVIIPIDTYYKVIFDSTGGSAVSMQFVKENCNAIEPAAPTRANYEFNFWVEKGTYEEFNFTTTPITHDIILKAVWTSTSPSPSPSDENKPNTDKEDTNSSGDTNNEEDKKDTSEDKEDTIEDKKDTTEDNGEDSKSNDNSNDNSESKDESNRNNGENTESTEDNNSLSDTSEENTETTETTETTEESSDDLINTHTNPSSNHSKTSSKTSTPSLETDPDIATNTETTDLLSEIKATVLGVFKTISKSITIVAKISLIGILIWFIWFVILLNNTLVKIQAPSEDQPDQSQPDQSKRQSKRQSKSWKTIYITPIKKTIEQTVGDKRTIWSLSLPQNLLDDNEELKVKIPWSVYHRAEDINQANQTELHITITPDQPEPMMIYIITNETKEIKIK